jgi:hypothetical protein
MHHEIEHLKRQVRHNEDLVEALISVDGLTVTFEKLSDLTEALLNNLYVQE